MNYSYDSLQYIISLLFFIQLDITGSSIYKYVHPCDQENLAKQLGGQVPLEDMEIFDGLFSSDTSHYVKNPKQGKGCFSVNHSVFFILE